MPKDVQLPQSKLLNYLRRSRKECDANIKAIDILEVWTRHSPLVKPTRPPVNGSLNIASFQVIWGPQH